MSERELESPCQVARHRESESVQDNQLENAPPSVCRVPKWVELEPASSHNSEAAVVEVVN